MGAENLTGLKSIPKLWVARSAAVGEHSIIGRSMIGRTCGRDRRENAGMSSENYVRIIMVENPRFLEEGSSAQGKPGAKARPKGVVDAHTVEIP